jgi:hypothetical protein
MCRTYRQHRQQGSRSRSKQPQPANDVRDNKYRPDLVSPCSIGQASVTAADDAEGADANAALHFGNRACEPGFTGVGALATFPNLPGRNDFVFVPALALAGAPIGAFPTSCRRLLGEGSAKTVLSAWPSAMSRAAHRSAVPVAGRR